MGSGRRKVEPIDNIYVFRKREAVALGQGCADALLKNYKDPSRKKVHRGEPIGLSRKKFKAAMLAAILYPLLPLKEIGRLVGVSGDQVRVWRTEPAFQDAQKWASEQIGIRIRNTILRFVEKIEDPEAPPKEYLEVTGIPGIDPHPHLVLLKLLPFFSDAVLLPTSNLLDEKSEAEKEDPRYEGLATILVEAIYLRRDKNLEKWVRSPLRIQNMQLQLARLCFFTIGLLRYPENRDEIIGHRDVKEVARSLKTLQDSLAEGINLLAK